MRFRRRQEVLKEPLWKPTPGVGLLEGGKVILTAAKGNPEFLPNLKQGPGCPPVTVLWPSDAPVVHDEESVDLPEKGDMGMTADEDIGAFASHHVEETRVRPVGEEILVDPTGTSVNKKETESSCLKFVPGEKVPKERLVLPGHRSLSPGKRYVPQRPFFFCSVCAATVFKVKPHPLVVIPHDGGDSKIPHRFDDLIWERSVPHEVPKTHHHIHTGFLDILKDTLQCRKIRMDVRENSNAHRGHLLKDTDEKRHKAKRRKEVGHPDFLEVEEIQGNPQDKDASGCGHFPDKGF